MGHPLALAAGCALDSDAKGLIDAASAAGFDAVGLRVSGPHAVADPATLRAAAAAAGVAIHDVEVHRIGGGVAATELLDVAHALGAAAVLVVSDLTDVRETTAEVDRLTQRCEGLGLVLGLEYMAWTTPSGPRAALEVARRTGCRLVVDVLHHSRVGAGVDELRAIIDAGALGWLQLCDAPLASPGPQRLLHEARHERLPPGDGGLPLAGLLGALPEQVVVSVEVQSDQLAAELDVAARARVMRAGAARSLSHRG